MAMPIDWTGLAEELDAHGSALIPRLLDDGQCDLLIAAWDERDRFRSEVVMARHGYGRGAYRYFGYPLPDLVAGLRTSLYPPLAAIANRWAEALGSATHYSAGHDAFLDRCRTA